MESLETGKAEYDSYIRNGLMVQMQRLEPGADIEESHMRNRQWVSAWAFEKGMEENVISKVINGSSIKPPSCEKVRSSSRIPINSWESFTYPGVGWS